MDCFFSCLQVYRNTFGCSTDHQTLILKSEAPGGGDTLGVLWLVNITQRKAWPRGRGHPPAR
jgi:hypothetical protein